MNKLDQVIIEDKENISSNIDSSLQITPDFIPDFSLKTDRPRILATRAPAAEEEDFEPKTSQKLLGAPCAHFGSTEETPGQDSEKQQTQGHLGQVHLDGQTGEGGAPAQDGDKAGGAEEGAPGDGSSPDLALDQSEVVQLECVYCSRDQEKDNEPDTSKASRAGRGFILMCNYKVGLLGWTLFQGCGSLYCQDHGSFPKSIASLCEKEETKQEQKGCFQINYLGHSCKECESQLAQAHRRKFELSWLLRGVLLLILIAALAVGLIYHLYGGDDQRAGVSAWAAGPLGGGVGDETQAYIFEVPESEVELIVSKPQSAPLQSQPVPRSSLIVSASSPSSAGVASHTAKEPSSGKKSVLVSPTDQCKLLFHRSEDGRACEQEVCNPGYYLGLDGKCKQMSCADGFRVDHTGKHCIKVCPEGHFFNGETNLCQELICPKYKYASLDGEECLQASCSIGSFTDVSGTYCLACEGHSLDSLEEEQEEECERKADFKQTFLSDYYFYNEQLTSLDYCGGEFISGLSKPTLTKWLSNGKERCPSELRLKYVSYPFKLDENWRWVYIEEVEKIEKLSGAITATAPEMKAVFVLNGYLSVSPDKELMASMDCENKLYLDNKALAVSSCFPILV